MDNQDLDEVFHGFVDASSRRYAKRIYALSEAYVVLVEAYSHEMSSTELALLADESVKRCQTSLLDVGDLPRWFQERVYATENSTSRKNPCAPLTR